MTEGQHHDADHDAAAEPTTAPSGVDNGPASGLDEGPPPQGFDPDWAWLRRIRGNAPVYRVYRLAVGFVGTVLVLGGLALVPLPGPGWFIVIVGIAVWSTEFERAQRLLEFVKVRVRAWEGWVSAQPRYVQAALALVTFLFVASVVWLTLRLTGLPNFLPYDLASWLARYAGL